MTMQLSRTIHTYTLALAAVAALAVATTAQATQVWSGRTFAFSKASNADPTRAANQDRITASVWITRASAAGLFNAASEAVFTHYLSPAGTEWASGDAANYGSLTFTDWDTWVTANGGPPSTVGIPACVHLVADDIYIDIVFDSWQALSGGAFSYHRAPNQVVTPTERTTWGAVQALYQ